MSSMSFEVAPKWTYRPASPHSSAIAFTTAIMSWWISSSIAFARSSDARAAPIAIASAASAGIMPTSASARASATSAATIAAKRRSSPQTARISGVPYRNSIGWIAIR